METKFTHDGKKVVVIDQLNSSEWIVQEIFIIDGKETPSGEKFTTKILHDAPAISWQEKSVADVKKMYEDEYKSIVSKRERMLKEWNHESAVLKKILSNIKSLQTTVSPEKFDTLIKFMSGQITHVIRFGYGDFEIIPFIQSIEYRDSYDSEIKLVSLYGRTNGDLEYKVNQYSDGSGSTRYTLLPFCSYKEALDYVKTVIIPGFEKDGLNSYAVAAAEKLKIKLPAHLLAAYYQKRLDTEKKNLDTHNNNLATTKKNISDIAKKVKKYSNER